MRLAVARIRATRAAVGQDIEILVEGHGRLSPNMAIRMARLLEEFNPFFFEEPVPPENIDEMARVAAAINIPVATGERLYTRWAFRELLEKQAADYIQPDLCHCGGFAEGRKIAGLAAAHNLPVTTHGVHDLQVNLLAAVPNASFLEVHMFGVEPYIRHPIEIDDGYAIAPNRPGHGVEFDWEMLSNHLVR